MNRALYPPDWEATALRVKTEADWTCQSCGRLCRKPDEDTFSLFARTCRVAEKNAVEMGLKQLPLLTATDLLTSIYEHPQRYTLTVAHINHDPENPNAELIAECSVCHLRRDAGHHAANARVTRLKKRGQMTLDAGLVSSVRHLAPGDRMEVGNG